MRPPANAAALLKILAIVACAGALTVASAALLGRGLERISSWTGPGNGGEAKVTLAEQQKPAPVTLGRQKAPAASPIGAIAGATAVVVVPSVSPDAPLLQSAVPTRPVDRTSRRTAGKGSKDRPKTSAADVVDLRTSPTITATTTAPPAATGRSPSAFEADMQPEETPDASAVRAQTVADTLNSAVRLKAACSSTRTKGSTKVCEQIAGNDPTPDTPPSADTSPAPGDTDGAGDTTGTTTNSVPAPDDQATDGGR